MPPIRFYTLTLVVSVLAAGCVVGCGGGGGGSSPVNVPVTTSWLTGGARGFPSGTSERITVHPLSQPSVTTTVVNLNSTASQQTTNVSLPPGEYVYHVDLYSGAGQTGSITGSLDAIVNTSSTTSVTIGEGEAISGIALGPSGISLALGGSATVYAGPTCSSGAYTFAGPTDLTFNSSSSSTVSVAASSTDTCAATVSGSGVGTANISAASASAPSASETPLSVTVAQQAGAKVWTIMVFLNASNDLCPEALPNYLQMQEAAQHGSEAQIIVAWKESKGNANANGGYDWTFTGADDTRYYLVQPSSGSTIVGTPVKDLGAGVDFGVPGSVNNFIAYCKKNFPATHYELDMWDHGDGWQEYAEQKNSKPKAPFRGISYDFETGNHIDSWQMDQCFTNGNNVDVLSYDACNMQMLECGYQVRNYVNYIVGSEDLTPGPGYDYSVALLPFFETPTGDPATLSQGFVNQMIAYTATGQEYAGEPICQSVVDASQLNGVASALDALGSALLANKTAVTSAVDAVRNTAKNYEDASNPYNMYFDGISVATGLENASGLPSAVTTAAANVITAIHSAVLYNKYDLQNLDAGSTGLSFDFSNSTTFTENQGGGVPSAAQQYANLAFAQNYPHWYDWLQVAP